MAGEASASFVTVTHPFHPLSGRRLRVLSQCRSPRGLEVVCDDGRLGRVQLPAAWTDRLPSGDESRVTVEQLAEMAAVMAVIGTRHAG